MTYNWHERHKAKRMLGARIADKMRLSMGSWPFVIGFLVFMGAWILTSGLGADPKPYGQLNLLLSALAGIQASLIMIAAKSIDDANAEQAKHAYETTMEAERRIEELQQRLARIDKKLDALLTYHKIEIPHDLEGAATAEVDYGHD